LKKPQWITIGAGTALFIILYFFGRTVQEKKADSQTAANATNTVISTDTILYHARESLQPGEAARITALENSVVRGDLKTQKLEVYHHLAHFWRDTARVFEPYAWYEAESARLENSEKNLTFAARLFLENLQNEETEQLRRWKALQAKDLFERSLTINPDNDSAKVGLGACYLFGGISSAPMEGLAKIMEVVKKDSTNVYAQLTLVKGAVMSGQYDKAIGRLQTVIRQEPGNMEALLLLADLYERTGKKKVAIEWYQKSLRYIQLPEARKAIEHRIEELRK